MPKSVSLLLLTKKKKKNACLLVVSMFKVRCSKIDVLNFVPNPNSTWAIRGATKKIPITYSFWLIFMNTCEYQRCIHFE